MADDPLSVTISAREIYDEIRDTRADIRSLMETRKNVDEVLDDHEKRIRSVERLAYGAAALAGLAATSAACYSAFIK
jgi:hypothetical protein